MDTQSRSYQITINNPVEKGFTDDKIAYSVEIERLGRRN